MRAIDKSSTGEKVHGYLTNAYTLDSIVLYLCNIFASRSIRVVASINRENDFSYAYHTQCSIVESDTQTHIGFVASFKQARTRSIVIVRDRAKDRDDTVRKKVVLRLLLVFFRLILFVCVRACVLEEHTKKLNKTPVSCTSD